MDVAVDILDDVGESLSPSEIAEEGLALGYLKIPRGRTRSYLNQILQSTLHNDAEYAQHPSVKLGATQARRSCW